jgi:hypothetical protein
MIMAVKEYRSVVMEVLSQLAFYHGGTSNSNFDPPHRTNSYSGVVDRRKEENTSLVLFGSVARAVRKSLIRLLEISLA